jgi:hypothetical protein
VSQVFCVKIYKWLNYVLEGVTNAEILGGPETFVKT